MLRARKWKKERNKVGRVLKKSEVYKQKMIDHVRERDRERERERERDRETDRESVIRALKWKKERNKVAGV